MREKDSSTNPKVPSPNPPSGWPEPRVQGSPSSHLLSMLRVHTQASRFLSCTVNQSLTPYPPGLGDPLLICSLPLRALSIPLEKDGAEPAKLWVLGQQTRGVTEGATQQPLGWGDMDLLAEDHGSPGEGWTDSAEMSERGSFAL